MNAPLLNIDNQGWVAIKLAISNGSRTIATKEIQYFAQCQQNEAESFLKHLEHCPYSWPLGHLDIQILKLVESAFQNVEKPEHFTNFSHCRECEEHDNTLRQFNKFNIPRRALGNLGYAPIGFSSPRGIAYYFPILARYAILGNIWHHYDNYAEMLIGYLDEKREKNKLYGYCNALQKQAVRDFLNHLAETQFKHFIPSELKNALKIWSE